MTMRNVGFIYGIHPVQTLLNKATTDIVQVLVDRDRIDKRLRQLINLAEKCGITVEVCNKATLKELVGEARHQGVIAQCKLPQNKSENDLITLLEQDDTVPLFLVLDQVQDPHNLGACLRSADACGVRAVIAPKDRAAGLTPTVFKVSCGAALMVPYIQVTNLARTLRLMREYGIQIVGTSDASTESIFDVDLKPATAIVLGTEAKGMRRLTAAECDQQVRLPMQGVVESLNVSVAAGVCLYELVRQRCL
ncbi:MAG: 23S rRNA (guanosine(2251)-2'-O)-methyltransferase RlmB [Thiohalomonadales bacterium]